MVVRVNCLQATTVTCLLMSRQWLVLVLDRPIPLSRRWAEELLQVLVARSSRTLLVQLYLDTTAYGAACTLAACMTFLYSGTTSDNAGFVYGVEDIAPSIFFNNQGGAAGSANGAVSIQVLTSYAKTRMRTPLEGLEIVVRPKRYVFRGPGSDTGTLAQFGAVDTLFGIGGASAQSTLVASDANLVAGLASHGLDCPRLCPTYRWNVSRSWNYLSDRRRAS